MGLGNENHHDRAGSGGRSGRQSRKGSVVNQRSEQTSLKCEEKKGKRNSYAAPKSLFDLDDKPSIKTINQKNDAHYECYEAEETLQLGVGKKQQNGAITVEDVDSDSEGVDMSGNEEHGSPPPKTATDKSRSNLENMGNTKTTSVTPPPVAGAADLDRASMADSG